MRMSSKFVAGLAMLAATALASCDNTPKTITDVRPDDMVMGSATAPVTMVEYASVACPHCGHLAVTVWPDVKAKYIDTGKVRYIYRPMPFGVPTIATSGELLAECAGKDKYFNVVEAIMRGQAVFYAKGETDALARPVLLNIAQSAGMSEADFTKCISDPVTNKKLSSRFQTYMTVDKIDETPTFFVNGKKLTLSKGDISDFDKAIQPLLKAK